MEQKLSFRLGFDLSEGISFRGDIKMSQNGIPLRTHRPIQQPVKVQEQEYDDTTAQIQQASDVEEEEYDDTPVAITPKSVLRHRPTQQQQPQAKTRTTEPIVAPVGQKPVVKTIVTHRVSGSTRAGLYVVLFLCGLFIFNGIVWPALVSVYNQVKYGDAQIATFDLDQHHFITQDVKGKVKIIVMSADNQHNQVLTQIVHGIGDRALVTLSENGAKIDVSNGQYAASLVSDNHGGYQWENS